MLTRHYVEPELGAKLADHGLPAVGEGTVIGAAEKYLTKPVMGARQEITAMIAKTRGKTVGSHAPAMPSCSLSACTTTPTESS